MKYYIIFINTLINNDLISKYYIVFSYVIFSYFLKYTSPDITNNIFISFCSA